MGISEVESKLIEFEEPLGYTRNTLARGLNDHAGKRTADTRRIEAK